MKSLQEIAALLENRKINEAALCTQKLNTEELSPADVAHFHLLEIEIQLLRGDYVVDDKLSEVITYYKTSPDTFKFAKAKYLHGWLMSLRGEYREARESLIEAYVSYKRCDDHIWQARALNRLGFICHTLGDNDAAAEHIQKAIEIYRISDEWKNVISCTLNLASVFMLAGNLRAASGSYLSLQNRISILKEKSLCIYHTHHSLALVFSGHIEQGKTEHHKAKQYIADFPREQAIYYENLGWIHLLAGEYKEAEEALLKGLKISLDIAPKSALVSQIKRRLGDAYLGLKDYDKAKTCTDEGLEVAQNINERVEIAACYRIYAQLACQNGNENEARDWFKKATDLFAMISSRYELAVTRYLAATSGVYHNGERQAMLYMAREYFQSEEVTPYLEKIDAELAKIKSQPMPRPGPKHGRPPVVIALNPAMKRLIDMAEHVAPSDMNVLLTGPTGTGKDLLARFIHYHSGRTGEFVTVNAAAMPQHMAESEFFGYKKGAYTGADKNTPGLFETADGGTFYLNEIADATPEIQAKLLDVLEHKTVRRLGERTDRKVDFRLIAATNHDIEQLIRDGRFRADLYHRLNEIPITLPALCERPEDIPALLRHFLKPTGVNREEPDLSRLAQVLAAQSWPGNVRQLEAEIKRLAALADSDISKMIEIAQADDLLDKNNLSKTLIRVNWNQSEAAKILGVTEGTIRYRIRKYKLSRPPEFVKDDSCS